MQPRDFKTLLIRVHYVIALEGTNNTLFWFATSAPIDDKQRPFPTRLRSALGLSPDINTMFDYKNRIPGIYERLYQFCVISLCSDMEFFFKDLFSTYGYKKGRGRGFFQRFDGVISQLSHDGIDFSSIDKDLKNLRLAFMVRHISVHNLGLVDQDFVASTKLPVKIGDRFDVDQTLYRKMFDSYVALLKHIDSYCAI